MYQSIDGGRGARAAEDHRVLVVPTDLLADDLSSILSEPCGLAASPGGFRVSVGVKGQHRIADEVLHEIEGASGSGVVGIYDGTGPERPLHDLMVSDHRGPNPGDQRV